MAYIPFVYFTLLLIFHLTRSSMRFGAGAMSILCVDVSALFSIFLDERNLYGEMGCNPYALTLGGVILYCLLWTIVLYPIMQLDKKNIKIVISKDRLLRCINLFFIVCLLIYIIATGSIEQIIEKITTTTRSEAYDISNANDEIYHSRSRFLLWLPMIIANSSPLFLLLWFMSISVAYQPMWIRIGLLMGALYLSIVAYAGGGRAQLIWFVETFAILFALFYRELPKQKRAMVFICSISSGFIAIIGVLLITISRFDSSVSDYAVDSFVGYAGQNLNNFCACLPYVDEGHFYSERILPLTTFLKTRTPYNMQEYYSFLSLHYPIQVNVFFTVFGNILMDMGFIGLCVFLIIYLIIAKSMLPQKNNTLPLFRLFLLAIIVCVPVRGLYGYPFTTTNGTLYLFIVWSMYLIFKYNITYGKDHNLQPVKFNNYG